MKASTQYSDRRAVYRVRPPAASALRIGVSGACGEFLTDDVDDLSALGAALILPDGAAALGDSERVRIAVKSAETGETVAFEARVLGRSRTGRGWHCRFAFDERALGDRHGAFFELFNRRAAYRGVRPRADAPVTASVRALEDAQREFAVCVCNISTGGLCAEVDTTVDAALGDSDSVLLRLRLPAVERALEIAATVRYRAVGDDAVLYGMRFEPGRTPDYIDHAEDLLEYLLAHFEQEIAAATHH